MPGAKDPTPLTFTFKNIGPIKDAELELGDLTIIAGRNNTGKTYLVYTLYGFLTTWEDWPGPALRTRKARAAERARRGERYPVFEQISDQVDENGQAEVLVDRDALSRERRDAVAALTRRFSDAGLAGVFSSSPEKFEGASIGVKLSTESPWQNRPVAGTEPVDTPSIHYDGAKLIVVVDQPESKLYHATALRRRLWRRYLRFLSPTCHRTPSCFCRALRHLALLQRARFQEESTRRSSAEVRRQQGQGRRFPFLLLDETISRYARPIKDNIDYTRSIPDFRKQKSEVYDDGFFNDIKRLMNGYYAASNDAIEFRSDELNDVANELAIRVSEDATD